MLEEEDRAYAYVVSPERKYLGLVSADSLRSALDGHTGPLGLAADRLGWGDLSLTRARGAADLELVSDAGVRVIRIRRTPARCITVVLGFAHVVGVRSSCRGRSGRRGPPANVPAGSAWSRCGHPSRRRPSCRREYRAAPGAPGRTRTR